MGRTESGLSLRAALGNSVQALDLSSARTEVITSDDAPWLMTAGQVFQLQSDVDIEYISPWLQNPVLDIPANQEDQFLEEYYAALAARIPIDGPDISWEDVNEEPIKRLYAAGECGSAFGYLYLSGANLSECLITGKVAGHQAADLSPWDQTDLDQAHR